MVFIRIMDFQLKLLAAVARASCGAEDGYEERIKTRER